MRCEVAINLMSAYADNEINQIEKTAFEKHLSECTDCREEYELLLEVLTGCSSTEEAELPAGFGEELHWKLLNEKNSKSSSGAPKILSRSMNVNKKWKIASGLVAAVLVVALAAGGAYSYILDKKGIDGHQDASVSQSALMDRVAAPNYNGKIASVGASNAAPAVERKEQKEMAPAAAPAAGAIKGVMVTSKLKANFAADNIAGSAPGTAQTEQSQPEQDLLASRSSENGRKVIKTGTIILKVTKLDGKVDEIKKLAEQNGGYVESSNIDNIAVDAVKALNSNEAAAQAGYKTANMAIRVPAESFSDTFDTIKSMGVLENENTNGNDITYQYRDTYTRCENLKVQEKSLLGLMAKAKNVDEILQIEDKLNQVRTDIELMTGDLKRWDDLIDLSTININLTEVKEGELSKIDVPDVWSRAYKGFVNAVNSIVTGLEKLFVFIVSAVPYIIIFCLLLIPAVYITKRIRAKKKNIAD